MKRRPNNHYALLHPSKGRGKQIVELLYSQLGSGYSIALLSELWEINRSELVTVIVFEPEQFLEECPSPYLNIFFKISNCNLILIPYAEVNEFTSLKGVKLMANNPSIDELVTELQDEKYLYKPQAVP